MCVYYTHTASDGAISGAVANVGDMPRLRAARHVPAHTSAKMLLYYIFNALIIFSFCVSNVCIFWLVSVYAYGDQLHPGSFIMRLVFGIWCSSAYLRGYLVINIIYN